MHVEHNVCSVGAKRGPCSTHTLFWISRRMCARNVHTAARHDIAFLKHMHIRSFLLLGRIKNRNCFFTEITATAASSTLVLSASCGRVQTPKRLYVPDQQTPRAPRCAISDSHSLAAPRCMFMMCISGMYVAAEPSNTHLTITSPKFTFAFQKLGSVPSSHNRDEAERN